MEQTEKTIWSEAALKIFAEFDEYYDSLTDAHREAMRKSVVTFRQVRQDGSVVDRDEELPPRAYSKA